MAPSLVISFLLVACAYFTYALYTALLTPLAKIPNAHWTAPLSKYWLLSLRWSSQEHRTRYLLHRKLGPVIRLGPSEVSVNCLEDGVHTVYNGDFDKSPWFQGFVFYNQLFMFTMLSSKAHGERKRMMTAVYSKSYVQNSSALTKNLHELIFQRLLPRIKSWASESATVDMHSENQAFSIDMTSSYLFGLHAGSNLIEQLDDRKTIVTAFTRSLDGVFWHEFPVLVRVSKWVGVHLIPSHVFECVKAIEDFCAEMCERAKSNIGEESSTARKNTGTGAVVYPHLYKNLRDTMGSHSSLDHLVAAEMLDHLIAGNDGNANTLSFLLWELSCHPDFQKRLRAELLQLDRKKDLPNAQDLDQAPLLDSALMETLRLHPAGLGPHLRVVPTRGTKLGLYSGIPAGTTVSATAWAMHRNEEAYPDPEKWQPDRWLESSKEKEMQRWFFAFGTGARKCIGNHLGIRAIKTYVAVIYCKFHTYAVDHTGLEITDSHMGRPVGNQLLLKFRQL